MPPDLVAVIPCAVNPDFGPHPRCKKSSSSPHILLGLLRTHRFMSSENPLGFGEVVYRFVVKVADCLLME